MSRLSVFIYLFIFFNGYSIAGEVYLAEGRVSIYEYSFKKEEVIEYGTCSKKAKNNICSAIIEKVNWEAYISNENMQKFGDKIVPGIGLLLIQNKRVDINYYWEVVGVEVVLEAGEAYKKDKNIHVLNENDKQNVLKSALDLLSIWLGYKNKIIYQMFLESQSKNIDGFAFDDKKDYSDSSADSFGSSVDIRAPEEFDDDSTTETTNPNNPEDYYQEMQAIIRATPLSGDSPLTVDFDASSSRAPSGGAIVSYSWDFDNSDGVGVDATGISVNNTYTSDGSYIVTLTIRDDQNNLDSATVTINVGSAGGGGGGGLGYYVDAVAGSDVTGDGSISNPWQTLTYAMTQVDGVTATTIYMADGSYTTAIGEVFPIAAADNVTIEGNSLNAIIDGDGAATARIMNINNLSSFDIDTVTFRDAESALVIDNSTVTVSNSHFRDIVTSGLEISIFFYDSNLTINNSSFYDGGGGIQEDITAGPAPSTLVVDNSEFYNHQNWSIFGENIGSDYTITDSIFRDGWSVYLLCALGFHTVDINRCIFYGDVNTFFNNALVVDQANLSLRNSIFYNVSDCDYVLRVANCGGNAQVYNCTFDRCNPANGIVEISASAGETFRNNAFTNVLAGYGVRITGGTTAAATTFDNNLFFNNAAGHVYQDLGAITYTVVALNGLPLANANIDDDPDYKDPFPTVPPDYRPDPVAGPASPLIDAGIAAGSPSDDYLGNARPYNGIYDIGAYEYQGNPADPIVSGRIYNSVTNETIRDAYIGIYKNGKSIPEATAKRGVYSFNVLPGDYFLAVKKDGFHFPSIISEYLSPESKGEVFRVYDGKDVRVDIPLDPSEYLEFDKTSNKRRLIKGEIVTINLWAKNPYLFDTIHNISIKDAIPLSMKYIQGSARMNGKLINDPNISNKDLSFYIGSLQSRREINISYQLVVTSGARYGEVFAEAYCENETTIISEKIRNIFQIIPDSLFNNGTLLGMVYIDENQNGVYDRGENSIGNVDLVTEYGVRIKADQEGKFHIPDIYPGMHVIKVVSKSLSNDFEPGDAKIFEIKKGEIEEVKIPVLKKSYSDKTQSSFLIAALGDITYSKNKISGNTSIPLLDKDLKEGYDLNGRAAVYFEGETNKGIKIKGSLDTDRDKDDYKSLNNNKLITKLDDEHNYLDYGDESKVDHSFSDTMDVFSLEISKDESYVKWGNMEISYPHYRRVFHGGEIMYESNKSTSYEEPSTEIGGFYATSDHKTAYEELNGTGGSVYYLKNSNIIEGSERVSIQVRESVTKQIIKDIVLDENDYDILYNNGRIILKKPLNTYTYDLSGSIIKSNINPGDEIILIVTYEYENSIPLDRVAYGGRITKFIGDYIKISSQYVEEDRNNDSYTLNINEILLRKDQDSWLRLQYGKSQEGFSFGKSWDGGDNFWNEFRNKF
ncbi:hypothetical protein BVX93_01700 [bacterium B13(2017)]|nr:hypothetical protein BVX93_01700 [bacterium B13(2017)]